MSGDAQTLDVGETSAPLTVQVLDQDSEPMSGVAVTFTGSGVEHTLSGQSATTGANGQASVTVIAGSTDGTIEVEAAVTGLTPVVFTLTVQQVLTPTSLTLVSGDAQTLDLNETSAPLIVEVLDQNNDPMEGVSVTFAGSGVSHSLSATTAATGADGQAEITATAGTEEGTIEVEATVGTLDPVVFTLTVEEALVPTTLTIVSGDAQSLDFNQTSAPLVVEALDQNSNPMEGVTVTFVGSGVDHTLSAATDATGADGRAQITVTAGVVDGDIAVEASVGELTPVTFGLTVNDAPFSVPAPSNVNGIAFDGTWLWAVGGSGASPVIYRLDPTDGSVEQSFAAPGADHRGLAWDGQNLWYASHATLTIYQIDPIDGTVLNSFTTPGTQPRGLTWVDGSLWHNDSTGDPGTVYRLFPENGTVLSQFTSPVSDPLGLTWDGTHFWTAQITSVVADRTLVRFNNTGAVDTNIPNPGTLPIGLTFQPAGPWLWAADNAEGVIHRIKR